MIHHILVPLDGSSLAECVLPHVILFSRALGSQVTLLQALDQSQNIERDRAVDPLDWHIRKAKAEVYLMGVMNRLQNAGIQVKSQIVEGQAAERIIEFAQTHAVDLIALSSHGLSGLSGWNVSSVVQKIILRSYKSTLLVRAYQPVASGESGSFRYNRLLIPLDGSKRAECALPLAINLASYQNAQLLLAHVVAQPEMPRREPLTAEETALANRIIECNRSVAAQYLDQLQARLSANTFDLQTRLMVGEHPTNILHQLISTEKVDLMLLVAHGYTGITKWPFGSVTTSFIAYGTSSLLIIQDLSPDEVASIQPEVPVRIR